MRHPWAEYERRFVVNCEWPSFPKMQEAIARECAERGETPPSLKLLQKRAGIDKWIEKRRAVDAEVREETLEHVKAKLARRLAKRVERLIDLDELAAAALNLGARHVARMHASEAAGIPQVATVYEAESLIRTGALLSKLANDTIAKILNPDRHGPAAGGDEGDGIARGHAEIPPQLPAAEWDAARRLNLGAEGGKDEDSPTAIKALDKPEEPKP